MSDNLRYRIAYAIAQADGDLPGMEPASCDYEMADAVIAALGLTRDPRYPRWVTHWLPDETYCTHCGIPHTDECLRK